MRQLISALGALACVLILSGSASAAFSRTYVSVAGNDANNCSLATPCRFFSGAVPKTLTGGEIVAITDGEYGSVTINKSLTLMAAPGVHAALGRNVNENVVTVSAASSSVVVLRNLYISRISQGGHGIEVTTAGALHIENCTVARFTGDAGIGISVSSTTVKTFIKDSFIRDNGFGIFARGKMMIDNTRIENNNSTGVGYGVGVAPSAKVTISNSTVSGHSIGLSLQFSSGAVLTVEDCVIVHNSFGISIISTESAGTVRVSNSLVTQNGTGFQNATGVFESRGNNTVRGNTTNTSGTITVFSGT